jgi:LAS seventeen-binding protein 5
VESDEEDAWEHRGSLSDYSDYQSSDEETHARVEGEEQKGKRAYVTVSDDEDDIASREPVLRDEPDEDPFADPFEKLSVSQNQKQHY